MSETLILAAAAFLAGFVFGFVRPAGYCHLSTAQRYAFMNRSSSGIINGIVFSAIVAVITFFAFG